MPPRPLIDLESLNLEAIVADKDVIRALNSQRFEMEMLDRIVHLDTDNGEIAGVKVIQDDEFWVRGHFPDRPVFPGVLMIEAAGQLCSFYVGHTLTDGGVLGFAGANDVKFRALVRPGDTLLLLGKFQGVRARQARLSAQAFVDGKLVFEAEIAGMMI